MRIDMITMPPFIRILAVLLGAALIQACSETPAKPAPSGHPNLTVTESEIAAIVSKIDQVPKAKQALEQLVADFDQIMALPTDVPVPKDAGGGYTHEQHKRNFKTLYNAGLLFQLTKEQVYSDFARDMFLEYAELYPTLGIHPKRKEQTPGKLFWQSLNEAMWLVHTIQAYDMLVSSFSESDRQTIETQLLRPVAKYLSEGQPQTFNKIHNHGTWAAAAVGMTGYVLGEEILVKQALYGLDMSGKGGFLKQMEDLFSPDGYYAEGPYYQRFALLPFVLFAKAIQVNEPEQKIFEHLDKALLKAIRTVVQLSYNNLFFGINDAIKDKGVDTIELVHGVAIAYDITKDPTLLSVAENQGQTILTGYGFEVAAAIEKGLAEPFQFKSMQLRDGKDGDQGALAIFRSGFEQGHQALVMKNTSQGLGHGHFDKLHWLYFDNGLEIISDYGAARFLNIEAKYGGHYLPENNAWAKQTVAHNTVVVDEQSHFNGDWRVGQKSAPKTHFFDVNEDIKITSASINDAYDDTKLSRTMAMVSHDNMEYPFVIDIFKLSANSEHQYDLPLHYQGQLISHNTDFKGNTKSLSPLGENNGYQYLWDRGRGKFKSSMAQMTWLNSGRFYTHSTLGGEGQELIFAQLGANDPNFNLINQSALIHRVASAQEHTFVSVLEQHGEYNGTAEYTLNAKSNLASLSASSKNGVTVVDLSFVSGGGATLALSEIGDEATKHKVDHNGQTIEWVGHYTLIKAQ